MLGRGMRERPMAQANRICGLATATVAALWLAVSWPGAARARGGDTAKQRSLGFEARITFPDGVRRALDYFNRKAIK